ncbi:polysaccharide biosynthesis protein [Patescibacteria group bacterium]|nr:polysaccharide biosynthesis protein [Patescibacteria group bacterium]
MTTILVTGGTGSLGQALVRRLLADKEVRRVRVFSRSEYLQAEMRKEFTDDRLRFLIGDIRDPERLDMAMDLVDCVIHCAALKRVESCEYNPIEAVKTNILGSANIISVAINHGVRKVLAISSDKGVNPVNLYGATKLTMEKLFIHTDGHGATMFSCCRMGNFIGSKGSLIPELLKGRTTGKIAITDGNMRRYWIPLEDAAEFVVNCLILMKGGEIFVPNMRELSVNEWAEIVAPDAEKKIVGARPGERMNEPLFTEEEERIKQPFKYGWVIRRD